MRIARETIIDQNGNQIFTIILTYLARDDESQDIHEQTSSLTIIKSKEHSYFLPKDQIEKIASWELKNQNGEFINLASTIFSEFKLIIERIKAKETLSDPARLYLN
ncbi:MAG: hypothetical protein Fur0024_1330 [Patescibacteria group bacterium]